MEYFRYTIPTYPFFYSQNMGLPATVFYKNEPVTGGWYVKFSNKETSEGFVIEKSFLDPGRKLLQKLIDKDVDFENYLLELSQNVIGLADKFEEINYQDLKNNTVTDLNQFYPDYKKVFGTAIAVGYSLDYAFDKYVKEQGIDLNNIKPVGESFLLREKRALKKAFTSSDQAVALADHANMFSWIKNNYAGENRVTVADLEARKSEVINLPEENIDQLQKPNSLIEWVAYLTFIRDERKRLNLIAIGLMDRWLKKYCQENKVGYEVAVFNTIEEILRSPASDLKDYQGLRFVHVSATGPQDITKTEWDKITTVENSDSKVLKGSVAHKGKVVGPAKIVITASDFAKVNPGDILVASMTRPEFMPVIERCGGIVTDEGGITCHAAIVAREFKKPCIIGTRNATKVLKDGDVVEVDADRGMVKIIKQNMKYSFLEKDWKKNWAGGWSLLSCAYLAHQYTVQLKEVLGVGLEEALFISHKGITSCYFIDERKKSFGINMVEQAKSNPDIIGEWAQGFKDKTDLVLNLIKDLKTKDVSLPNFESFIEAMKNYGVYHRIVKIAVDYLPQDLLNKYLEQLTEARVYAEPVYEEMEKYMQYMAGKISIQSNIRPELILATTRDQFMEYFKSGQLPAESILAERYENSVIYVSTTENILLTGIETTTEIEQALLANTKKENLTGQTAFGGKVSGRVRIILNPSEQKEFNVGDILVTGMTRPEYLHYVEKSAGFVTDAGGILSHAAITARELKKPCVIGTETATKVLKDGDMVEIDADSGVVKIIS